MNKFSITFTQRATALCLAAATLLTSCEELLQELEKPGTANLFGPSYNECPVRTVTLTAEATGAESFQWKKDGYLISDQAGATLIVTESGTYTAAGINDAGLGSFSEPHRVDITSCAPSPVSQITYRDDLDVFTLTATYTGHVNNYQWQLADGNGAKIVPHNATSASLRLPSKPTTVTVRLTVSNENGNYTATQQVPLPALTYSRLYGIGRNLTAKRSNNVTHSWYIDQATTGRYANGNCGPTCATMAAKWYNSSFARSVEEARNTIRPTGEWWYTNDVSNYLKNNHTGNFYADLNQASDLKSRIDNGHIVILCLDMYYVRELTGGKPDWHIDKFYHNNAPKVGHFIIVKGYRIVDGVLWFEVYDPASSGRKYSNGGLKGLDRYYRAEDIMRATNVWWKYMIVIDNPLGPTLRRGALDPSTIVHQKGR